MFGELPQAMRQKCNNRYQFKNLTYPQLVAGWPTQIGLADSMRQLGDTMRLDTVDDRATQSVERKIHDTSSEQSLLTPARRAALDALEREFRELLQPAPR